MSDLTRLGLDVLERMLQDAIEEESEAAFEDCHGSWARRVAAAKEDQRRLRAEIQRRRMNENV